MRGNTVAQQPRHPIIDIHIYEQVDEALAEERLLKYWQENKKTIIAGFVLFFVFLFAYVGFLEYRMAQDRQASEQFLHARDALKQGNLGVAKAKVSALLDEFGGHGYALLGQFLNARALTEGKETDAALKAVEAVVVGAGADHPLRQVALLNAAYLTLSDSAKAEGYLAQIPSESPFGVHVLALRGLMAHQRGDTAQALTFYRQAMERNPPGTLRTRLQRRIDYLAGPPVSGASSEMHEMPESEPSVGDDAS
jgi:predicted negative regulator of RcsB-dependent stress response